MESSRPNAEQIAYWNERGKQWVAVNDMLDAMIGPLGRRALDRARVAAGESVLDVGCGCGDTTLELARRVGPSGRVFGVDISAPMLARARERARAAGATQVTFEQADAQTHAFPPATFDLIFSRFGVMFFVDPTAALANLRLALRPGGRLTFVCWQAFPQNPWMAVPLMAAAAHVTLPPPPAPGAPGPFSFADDQRVRTILGDAGFADVAVDALHEPLALAGRGGLEAAVEFALTGVGPLTAAMRDAGPAAVAPVRAAVREALAPYVAGDSVRLPSAAWIVSARRP
jgi:SAM-dependent methyltransferase